MNSIILLCLVCFGLCKILIEGSIFQGFRDWLINLEVYEVNGFKKWVYLKLNQLFSCYLCLGFQIGWFIGCFSGPFDYWNIIYNGAFFAATTWILNCFVQYLGNGNDPNRSIIVQFPENIKIENLDSNKDINNK
jgi:hypothetical protein